MLGFTFLTAEGFNSKVARLRTTQKKKRLVVVTHLAELFTSILLPLSYTALHYAAMELQVNILRTTFQLWHVCVMYE